MADDSFGYREALKRRVDQAPHEPRAGVRHWRLHPRCARIRCVACGRLRKETAHLCREGEGRLCAANRDESFPGLKTLSAPHCRFTNLPEKKRRGAASR